MTTQTLMGRGGKGGTNGGPSAILVHSTHPHQAAFHPWKRNLPDVLSSCHGDAFSARRLMDADPAEVPAKTRRVPPEYYLG